MATQSNEFPGLARPSFTFSNDLGEAPRLARESAGEKDVSIRGGADVIRQALAAGKPLFDGSLDLDLEPLEVYQSRWATQVRYAVSQARSV